MLFDVQFTTENKYVINASIDAFKSLPCITNVTPVVDATTDHSSRNLIIAGYREEGGIMCEVNASSIELISFMMSLYRGMSEGARDAFLAQVFSHSRQEFNGMMGEIDEALQSILK